MAGARAVSETNQSKAEVFSLVVTVFADPGEDVILSVHLSPETSAVSMEIRWFILTELIYQYKNGLERTNNDYEDRVSLSMQGLKRGNVSLTLRNVQESDSGEYTCNVYHDGHQKKVIVNLQVRGERQLQREIVDLKRQIKKVKLDGQIKTLELEKQIIKLEMERQIMEQERQIEDLERQIKELPLPTQTLYGSSPRRRNSADAIPPLMSNDDGTPMTPETEEQRDARDTSGVERESGDPNTTQTGEETTATDQETPGTSLQVQQRASTSVISPERATQTQEEMDQEKRQESKSTEQE